MNTILKYFLRGLAIVIPVTVTVYVLYQTFTRIDRLVAAPFPGAGFAITMLGIFAVGVLASNFIGRAFVQLMDRFFTRAPFVKIVYSSIKDLVEAFVGDRRRFNRPVIVSLSSDGSIKTVGFVTRDDVAYLGVSGYVAVYLPQAYNFAGNMLLLPSRAVEPMEADSSQVMAFIVSGGVSGFEEKTTPLQRRRVSSDEG